MNRFILAVMAVLNFSPSLLASFTIEVCKVPIGRLIGTEIPGVKHVFIRGNAKGETTSLNFGPDIIYVNRVVLGDSLNAIVTYEDYTDAECKAVFETEFEIEYTTRWNKIVSHYQDAQIYSAYQVYNVKGKNCSVVAQEACEAADLEFPFENINGQDHTAKLLYSLGDIEREGVNGENITNVFGSAVGIIGGLVQETEEGKKVGQVLNMAGSLIKKTDQENCVIQ